MALVESTHFEAVDGCHVDVRLVVRLVARVYVLVYYLCLLYDEFSSILSLSLLDSCYEFI
jgi:hypothetical protein